MSGRPGRSGRRPKTIEQHLADGTFRPNRHGPRPSPSGSNVVAMPVSDDEPESMPPWLTATLGPAGRQLVDDMWERYSEWNPSDLRLLRLAAEATDRGVELREAVAVAASLDDRLRLVRCERANMVVVANLLRSLVPPKPPVVS
jgi:hypothetical protein